MKYEDIPTFSRAQVEEALVRNNPEELSVVVLSAALYSDDVAWIESVCVRASANLAPNVPGNAVLALGHLARRYGNFVEPTVATEIVRTALSDSSGYVRGQAESAADDIESFTAYKVRSAR